MASIVCSIFRSTSSYLSQRLPAVVLGCLYWHTGAVSSPGWLWSGKRSLWVTSRPEDTVLGKDEEKRIYINQMLSLFPPPSLSRFVPLFSEPCTSLFPCATKVMRSIYLRLEKPIDTSVAFHALESSLLPPSSCSCTSPSPSLNRFP